MAEIDRLIDELRRDQQADPWHGPSARQVLEGVTAAAAAARPIPGAHSIWELALHIIAWRNEVARRVDGGEPAEPAEGDWPAVTDTGDAAWDRTRARMEESYDRLVAALRRLPEGRLDEPVSRTRDPGSGVTYYVTLHGVPQHDAYHLGQVSLLKRAFGL
ncbi:MAG TPA: DinB family protein [Gemmatimonadales bacterium]|nr:DinB family protein [Gemmatimonadales bacterium]